MKMIKIFSSILFLTLLLAYGCSDDLGNYDYKELNNVEVTGLPVDTTVGVLEHLVITPVIARELEGREDDLEFTWRIGTSDTISMERNLDYVIETSVPMGKNICYYHVMDKETGVRYYYEFELNVVATFNLGYYVLSEMPDESSLISYLNTNYNENSEWISTSTIGDYTLGNKPCGMAKNANWRYGYELHILTQEGLYPYVKTNVQSFLPTAIINAENYIKGQGTGAFSPTKLISSTNNQYFLTGNGFSVLNSGIMHAPSGITETYDWALCGWWGYRSSAPDEIWGYDKLSNKIYTIYNTPGGPLFDLNSITEAPLGDISFDGYRVMGLSKTETRLAIDLGVVLLDVVAGNTNEIVIHSLNMDREYASWSPIGVYDIQTSQSTILPVAGINAESLCKKYGSNFYITIGQSIYSTPVLNPVLTKIADIPVEYGIPMDFDMTNVGTNPQQLVIATYNEGSSDELKGSVIYLDPQKKQITNMFKGVCGKAVQVITAEK
ncbi:hypothetical protein BZG02_07815 [Labilibaculum filiforme]|uniref:Uncharacterized protein n=1 Tax=Labilibaculum filiforme TaxID=1940526 RepID=A0A2N3I0R0_9BACT|nr:PKD-like family lipoprotein [Labilibaculum filiforme]PKQ63908.1 hypothetical protein BZG02_07815 [Labilibaculum filiforme]